MVSTYMTRLTVIVCPLKIRVTIPFQPSFQQTTGSQPHLKVISFSCKKLCFSVSQYYGCCYYDGRRNCSV